MSGWPSLRLQRVYELPQATSRRRTRGTMCRPWDRRAGQTMCRPHPTQQTSGYAGRRQRHMCMSAAGIAIRRRWTGPTVGPLQVNDTDYSSPGTKTSPENSRNPAGGTTDGNNAGTANAAAPWATESIQPGSKVTRFWWHFSAVVCFCVAFRRSLRQSAGCVVPCLQTTPSVYRSSSMMALLLASLRSRRWQLGLVGHGAT